MKEKYNNSAQDKIRTHRKNCQGFTLVEVVLALALGAVVVLPLAMAAETSLGTWKANNEQSEMIQHMRTGMERMMTELRYANVITVANADTLSFETTYLVDTDPDIDTITYRRQSEIIHRSVNGGAEEYFIGTYRYGIWKNTMTTVMVKDFVLFPKKMVGSSLEDLGGDPLSDAVAIQIDLTLEDRDGDEIKVTSLATLRNKLP